MWKPTFLGKICKSKSSKIGPSTTKALKERGVQDVVETYESTELALADMVLSLF
ncbi:MAG: hypothetical protein CM15mP65_23110 [Crocinitomicaceae bacterium]|nr:MAG: hypothetical protein CM15mP65_23110 [Crocinitomicaceae bacterium]